jgi:hypothetical protein
MSRSTITTVFEIGIKRHRHKMRRRFGHWPFERHIVAHMQFKRADQAGFDCRDADFTVTLDAVTIADRE